MNQDKAAIQNLNNSKSLPEDYFDDDFNDEPCCYRCDNTGWLLICPDDLCRGSGECMHGDGEILCPDCKGANAF